MMIYRHLISCGYTDSAVAMERECNVGLNNFDLADNMDLHFVLQDFEEYFEIKFQRKPVLVKKNANADEALTRRKPPTGGVLPKINNNKSEVSSASVSGKKGLARQSS